MGLAAPDRDARTMRRGACPSLDAPMASGDGLLMRLRPVGSALSPGAMRAVAQAAQAHGNGLIEITTRGSLQLRGLTPSTTGPARRALRLALDVERSAVPVETPPLAGLDPAERRDPRPLAARLRAALAGCAPPDAKASIIVDGGGMFGLDALPASLRILAAPDGWSLGTETGLDDDAVLARAVAALPSATRGHPGAYRIASPIGTMPLADGTLALGLVPAMGGIAAETFEALAAAAAGAGAREARLAPGRGLFMVGLDAAGAEALRRDAAALGLIVAPDDARLGIAACAGRGACASGRIETRALAARLAGAAPGLFDGSVLLHVSGCAKGCAHPRAAPLALVGMEEGCGLVVGGRAGDAPHMVFAADEAVAAMRRLEALSRAGRHAQESLADWMGRVGGARLARALGER